MAEARAHSRFGGSAAERYMNCPGSVALVATVPNYSSRYAAEGSAAHIVAAQCLGERLHPTHFLGETIEVDGYTFIVTQEMCDAIVDYLNVVETEMARTRTAQYLVEQDFTLELASAEPGEVHGSNDCCVYHPETGRLRVFDYKHGAGVIVDVEDNKQLKFYALGALYANPDWRVKEVVLTIVQPRARDADGDPVRDWTFDLVEILEFQGEIDEAVRTAKEAEQTPSTGYLHVGAWCDKTWCPAKAAGKCPAVEAHALKSAGFDFEGVKPIRVAEVTPDVLPEPATLDGAHLAKIVAGLSVLSTWANRCNEYLEAMLMAGETVPGWKVVEKIGRAKWVDDPTQVTAWAAMMFDVGPDQLTPPKLVTIGDAEKLLKAAGATKEQIEDFKLKFTIKESSGLTIAQASDKRPSINPVAENFGGVNLTAIAAE